jgi:ATP-dependent protease ClpP protease subunit
MKIGIRGTIVPNDDKWIYEWYGMEATSPKDVTDILDKLNGEPVDVEINSVGGDVYSGSEIYTALKSYSQKAAVNVQIVGVAASAASVIAMAGTKVSISPTSQIMIHNVQTIAMGDYRDMQHEADVLKGFNQSIANAYMLKTKMSQEDLLKLMDDETWLTAQRAKELGFADEIMFDTGLKLAASISGMIPTEVINKMRTDRRQKQARLNFLKLKGATV